MTDWLPGQTDLFGAPAPDKSMLGKSKRERHADDLYETPDWVTQAIIPYIGDSKVWEPACGRGAMAKVLGAAGLDVAASDLRERGYGVGGVNFLTYKEEEAPDRMIVTNPPYSLAEAFVRKAILLAGIHRQRVALLLRNEWDCAASRVDLFGYPFATKLVLTDRPVWIPGTKVRPRHNYAWYIWDWGCQDVPYIHHHRREK